MKPFVLNIYKPKGMGSFDVVRHFKRILGKEFGKIGHFGTLDPFAEGLLMLGLARGAKLNDYVHNLMPKTYLAKGILGQFTETGDLTVDKIQVDDSPYLKEVIATFSKDFIQEKLREEFIGEYWQAPHKYSAAKFQGKKLHQWAREGVDIKKDKKRREIYDLEVVSYNFPELWIRYTVSSGTYIRTLFSEAAQLLGTLGVLKDLVREKIGHIDMSTSIKSQDWPTERPWDPIPHALQVDDVLDIPKVTVNDFQANLISNGVVLELEKHDDIKCSGPFCFIYNNENELLSLCGIKDNKLKIEINFS
ncbi:hypothetical protein N9B72_01390 [Bacteriovoracaceae bacterium]|nr:hypothetical protein [Bacteriovoracaceae bacterium]